MHQFLKFAALSFLLSTGCSLARNTAESSLGATRTTRSAPAPARRLPDVPSTKLESLEQEDLVPTSAERRKASSARRFEDRNSEQPPHSVQQARYVEEDDSSLNGEPEIIAGEADPQAVIPAPSGGLNTDANRLAMESQSEASLSAPRVYSLAELTAITEQEHPKLRMASAEIESVMGERVQAGLYPNPRMETNNPEIWAGRDSQVNFGWQQDFITKGKMRLDKAAADQKLRVTEAMYVVEKMRVLTQVRIQYIQALAARERLKNSEDILRISKTARDVSAELMETGERTLTDVLLLKNTYERARLAVENNQTRYEAELRQVAIAIGIPDLVVEDVSGSINDLPPYYDEPYIREFLQSNSAPMIMARAEVVRRKIMLNRAEVEPYPDFRFGPHYAASTTEGSTRQFWFTFVFDIPIWNLNQGNIRSARAEVLNAQAEVENRRMELLNDLVDIHARHKTSQLLLARIDSSILPNAEKTQQLVQEGYSEGTLDVNRLLEAQRALLEAKQDQIDAYEQAWRTAAELAGYLQFEQFP
ncbi:TolC family protein [Schlesneria sp.]|uniref:TolC family protein n=1 Tax=Schlesneria sp. TaxID=2762018 RepID=UPI002F16C661